MNSNLIYILSIFIYLFIYFRRTKMSFLKYQLLIATNYLFSLSFIQTLDFTLVLYSIFALIPFFKSFKISSKFEGGFLIYFFINLLFSMIVNGISNALSIFIIRFIGIVFFIYVFKNLKFKICNDEKTIEKLLFSYLVSEIFVMLLAYIISGGDSRLMLNYQCTVGAISISGIILVGYYFSICSKEKKIIGFLYSIMFTLISIISGTRGYLIICVFLLLIYFAFYGSKFWKGIAFFMLPLLVTVGFSGFFSNFIEVTRLGSSTGRRTSENLLVWKYMPQNPIRLTVGYGFGKEVNSLPNISLYISEVSDTSYTNYILYHVSGFHNLYATVYYSSGIIGVIFTLCMFIYIFKLTGNVANNKTRYILYLYIALYMFMLWYRWSATSGILEFATFAYIMFISEKKKGT